jgi:hypothetical protein
MNALDSAFKLGTAALERLFPDPVKRAEEMRKLEALRQNGDLARLEAETKLLLTQVEVNLKQAEHKSLFVSGARPFTMWVCSSALAYKYILYPLLHFMLVVFNPNFPVDQLPVIEATELIPVLMGLLGLGAMRTREREKGVQINSLTRGK